MARNDTDDENVRNIMTINGKLLDEKLLQSELETLRHGGEAGIAIFMNMSRHLHECATKDALKNWITMAAPALPEAERGEVLLILISAYLHARNAIPAPQIAIDAGDPTRTVH